MPERNGRREILEVHTRGMPLAEDVSVDKLAEITHGFVGADLAALCREAAMVTLRRISEEIPLDAEFIPYDLLARLEVSMDDFLEALTEVEPSALREVFTEVPDVRWEDVGGLDEAKSTLKQIIEWPLQYADLFERADTSPPKGVLLTGAQRHRQDAAGQGRRARVRRQLHLDQRPRAALEVGRRFRGPHPRRLQDRAAFQPLHHLLRRAGGDRGHGAAAAARTATSPSA